MPRGAIGESQHSKGLIKTLIENETHDALAEAARQSDRSLSAEVRVAVRQHLAALSGDNSEKKPS